MVADRDRQGHLQLGARRPRGRQRREAGHQGHPHGARLHAHLEREAHRPGRLPGPGRRIGAEEPRCLGCVRHAGRQALQGPHHLVPDLERGQPRDVLGRNPGGDGGAHQAGLRHHQGGGPQGARRRGQHDGAPRRSIRPVLPELSGRPGCAGLAGRRLRRPHVPDQQGQHGCARRLHHAGGRCPEGGRCAGPARLGHRAQLRARGTWAEVPAPDDRRGEGQGLGRPDHLRLARPGHRAHLLVHLDARAVPPAGHAADRRIGRRQGAQGRRPVDRRAEPPPAARTTEQSPPARSRRTACRRSSPGRTTSPGP